MEERGKSEEGEIHGFMGWSPDRRQGADNRDLGREEHRVSWPEALAFQVELRLLVRQPAERAEVGLLCLDFEQQISALHFQPVREEVH